MLLPCAGCLPRQQHEQVFFLCPLELCLVWEMDYSPNKPTNKHVISDTAT